MLSIKHQMKCAEYLLDSLYGDRYLCDYINGDLVLEKIDQDAIEYLWQKYGRMDDEAVAEQFNNEEMLRSEDEINELLDDPLAISRRINATLRLWWAEKEWPWIYDGFAMEIHARKLLRAMG